MTNRQNRMLMLATLVAGIALLGFLGFKTFNENLLYFLSPSDVVNGKAPVGRNFRLGGLVQKGSVERDGIKVKFVVTDNLHSFVVQYKGILPDLFREGKGIIAIGKLNNKIFTANEVLAKHDENYMPPEVAATLKKK